MADTNFVSGTVVEADWLQDVNDLTYGIGSTASASDGDAMIGVKGSATGSIATDQGEVNERSKSISTFMTDAQRNNAYLRLGTVDCSSAFTLAIASAAEGEMASLELFDGVFGMSSGFTVPRTLAARLKIKGKGKQASVLKAIAGSTFNAMITIGDTAGQSIRGSYEDFGINLLDATVQYGIYGARVEEHDFIRVLVWGAATAHISIGYGYVNNLFQCECSYGTGDGIVFNTDYLTGANNTNNIRDCLILNVGGFGVKANSGYGCSIEGNTIEVCARGGIYVDAMSSLRIGRNYFELNGLTGHTFTTPALTVKADIIINGSGSMTEMSSAFPSSGVVVEACNTVPRATSDAFVWNAGAVDLDVRKCFTNNASYVPAVAEHYNNAYKGQNVSIDGCTSFTTQMEYVGASSATNNTFAAYADIKGSSLNIMRRNLLRGAMGTWTVLVVGSAVTFAASAVSGLTQYHGCPVFRLNSSAAGTSDVYGLSLTATDYPELVGKLVWFGMWCYSTNANYFAVPYCNQQGFNINPTTLSNWRLVSVSFVWPASGTVDVGAFKSGGGTGACYVAAPMLCQVGVPHEEAIAQVN